MSHTFSLLKAIPALVLLFGQLSYPSPACAEEKPAGGRKIYSQALNGTTWVVTPDGSGSGWLADKANRLVITNYHVTGSSESVLVAFPEYDEDGKLIAEKEKYKRGIRAKILVSDAKRDIVVLQLESLPAHAKEFSLAASSASPGETVHSIGNPASSDALWIYTKGEVRQVYQKEMRYNGLHVKARIVETQSPINKGDSGGPVVDDEGKIVGMSTALNTQARLITSCVDVEEIRLILSQTKESIAERAVFPTAPLVVRIAPLATSAPQLRGLLRSFLVEKDREGFETFYRDWIEGDKLGPLDRKRPLAAYFTALAPDNIPTGVLLVPVSSMSKAKEFLEGLKILEEADAENIHKLKIPGEEEPMYVRFAHDCAFVAVRDRSLLTSKDLAEAAKVQPKGVGVANRLISVGLRLTKVTTKTQKDILGHLGKSRESLDEIDATKQEPWQRFGLRLLGIGHDFLAQWIKEGDESWMHFNYDARAQELTLESTVTARSATTLAKNISELGKNASFFQRSRNNDPALRLIAAFKLNKPLQDAFTDLLDSIYNGKDDASRMMRKKFSGFSDGDVDWIIEFNGPTPAGTFSLIRGHRLQDGAGLDQLVRKIFADAPEVTFDIKKNGMTSFHRGEFTKLTPVGLLTKITGKHPSHFITGRGVYLEMTGPESLEDLRTFLEAPRQIGPQFLFDTSAGRIFSSSAFAADEKLIRDAKTVFVRGVPDRVQLTIEGGSALKMRFTLNTSILKFVSVVGANAD
jgi:hypothetical protein